MNYGFCARCDLKLCVDIDQMRFDRPHANLESLRYLFVGFIHTALTFNERFQLPVNQDTDSLQYEVEFPLNGLI
jgi:hypothetical protein